MHRKLLFSLIGAFFFLAINGQETYKIPKTKYFIRYFKASDSSSEKLNDSLLIVLEKKNFLFKLSIVNKEGYEKCGCLYDFTGIFENSIITTRVTDTEGTRFVKKRKKIKVLKPVKRNCIKEFIVSNL